MLLMGKSAKLLLSLCKQNLMSNLMSQFDHGLLIHSGSAKQSRSKQVSHKVIIHIIRGQIK